MELSIFPDCGIINGSSLPHLKAEVLSPFHLVQPDTVESPPCWSEFTALFVHVLFLALFLVERIIFLVAKKNSHVIVNVQSGLPFWGTIVLPGLAGMGQLALLVRAAPELPRCEIVSVPIQAASWLCMAAYASLPGTAGIRIHAWLLRGWWLASFVSSSPLGVHGLQELLKGSLAVVNFLCVATWAISVILGAAAICGASRITLEDEYMTQGLLAEAGQEYFPAVEEVDLGESSLDLERENVVSRFLFLWMGPVLARGWQKPLEVKDLPQLGSLDQGEELHRRFVEKWGALRAAAPDREQGLVHALWNTFYAEVVVTGLFGLAYVLLLYVGPLMLTVIVNFVGEPNHSFRKGAMLVALMLFAQIGQSLAKRMWIFGIERMGMHMRSALITAVFQKGLLLSNKAKMKHGTGEIVNYMSVDVQRIADFMWWLHDVWMHPLQAIIAIIILFHTVGWGTVAGMASMVIFICLQIPVARCSKYFQRKLMIAKDARMKATTEYLSGMRVIKLWAWDESFCQQIENLRLVEFRFLAASAALFACNTVMLWLCPLVVAVSTLSVCVWLGNVLNSAQVFTAIATFRLIQDPLFFFPMLVSEVAQVLVSVTRIRKFLLDEELQADAVERLLPGAEPFAIKISGGTFTWGVSLAENHTAAEAQESLALILKNINLQIDRGSRVAVCGTVGGGKSSLLACVLGEMARVTGKVQVVGSIAYVSQSAWIQSGTIEDNILFGHQKDCARYDEALRASCLLTDLREFEYGDQTQIGERGLNLSGGQKQRIQLARALYKDSDIYLLDDPFSAVDAHTGSELFKECILGALVNKTVVLVTHQVEFLPAVDLILVMKDGQIVQSGNYSELLEQGMDFEALVGAHNGSMLAVNLTTANDSVLPATEDGAENKESKGARLSFDLPDPLSRKSSTESLQHHLSMQGSKSSAANPAVQLVNEEERETGKVGLGVYWAYLTKAFRGWLVPFVMLFQVAFQCAQVAGNWWLAYATTPENHISQVQFIQVYAFFALGGIFFVVLRAVIIQIISLVTAQCFFHDMLRALFRAPMSYFDTTPTGRILARASADQSTVDSDLPFMFSGTMNNLVGLIGIMVVTTAVTKDALVILLLSAIAMYFLQKYYLKSSREITRVQATTKAPVIDHFSESIAGAITIRSFQEQPSFYEKMNFLLNVNSRPILFTSGSKAWFIVRMEGLSTLVFCASALLLVALPSSIISPALAGLSLSYGLSQNQALTYFNWFFTSLENQIISVERIRQYTMLPAEAPRILPESRPLPDWPTTGTVDLQALQIRYREGTPLVLRSVTCVFSGGHKVGVVGRTGSGKSTLIQALFRIVEPAGGRIVIDGLDISSIGLADLRKRLSIIPQEPTLFDGSIRSNIDPLDEHSEAEIWQALEKCQLATIVRSKELKLEAAVMSGGENWSVGQRQLLALGRALLKRTRIVVLDEATASVDTATDRLIQETIRTNLADCTVISVAHRIPTVIDSDEVLVLDAGVVAEYDSPQKLLGRTESMFLALVKEYSGRSGSMAGLAALARFQSAENDAGGM